MSVKRLFPAGFDSVFVLILVLAAFLFLFRLDHRPFWQDEAETACLARNVLKYGVPKAYDGVNLISQEQGREFGPDYIWRWSPWLQIYLAAGAFRLEGLGTGAGRLPFALAGLACVGLVYLLIRRRFGDRAWANLAAAWLATSVVFILFSRECRGYGVGAFLALAGLMAFRARWQSRLGPAAWLVASFGLLFYANYLLFFSYSGAFLLAAVLLYRREMPLWRSLGLSLLIVLMVVPGMLLFRLKQQSGMLDLTMLGVNLEHYYGNILMFMIPLPVALGLAWHWREIFRGRLSFLKDSQERFILFLVLLILFNTAIISLVPQREHRYQVHLYPLCAILLGWVILRVGRWHKFSGVLLGLLLVCTNWLCLVPMYWLGIANRPPTNDFHMLTYPNLSLRLYLGELFSTYPDVNASLISFFNTQGRPGDAILTTYGDLPLQFYTPYKVVGGLQWRDPPCGGLPRWVVKRFNTGTDRQGLLNRSEELILRYPRLAREYEAIVLPYPDEPYGNRADPYHHHFLPPSEPFPKLTIYRQKAEPAHETDH